MIGREKPGEQSEVAQLIQQTLEQERWQREMMEQRYKQYMDEDEEVRADNQRLTAAKTPTRLACPVVSSVFMTPDLTKCPFVCPPPLAFTSNSVQLLHLVVRNCNTTTRLST